MTFASLRRTAFLAVPALLLTLAPASAHHAMGGGLPSTFGEGLLSGLGHPVIGPDHLAFLIAIGVAVGAGGLSLALPFVFVAASAIGVALHVSGMALPGAELIVAASVIAAGILIAHGRAVPLTAWAALFGLAGLAHGYAYGELIFGAEPTPLFAYLLGLVAIQSALDDRHCPDRAPPGQRRFSTRAAPCRCGNRGRWNDGAHGANRARRVTG